MAHIQLGIPQRMEDPRNDAAHLIGEYPLMDHEQVHIRAETDFTSPIAAQSHQCNGIVEDFPCLFLETRLQEQGPDEPIHEIGISPRGEKT